MDANNFRADQEKPCAPVKKTRADGKINVELAIGWPFIDELTSMAKATGFKSLSKLIDALCRLDIYEESTVLIADDWANIVRQYEMSSKDRRRLTAQTRAVDVRLSRILVAHLKEYGEKQGRSKSKEIIERIERRYQIYLVNRRTWPSDPLRIRFWWSSDKKICAQRIVASAQRLRASLGETPCVPSPLPPP